MTSSADSFGPARGWRGALDVDALARMPLPLAVVFTVVCPALAALGEWHWARRGMNWEHELIAQGRPFEVPLAGMLALASFGTLILIPLSIVLLQGVLRVLRCTPQPFGVLYRVLSVAGPLALLKALPWIGWFLAVPAVFVLPLILLARVQAIRLRTAFLATLPGGLVILPLQYAAARLIKQLL